MRATLLALLALSLTASAPPDAPRFPPELLDLLGRCDDELPALGCTVESDGHGSCDAVARGHFVELDVCDASGAFAAHGYVCGVRSSDCLWCTTSHEVVLPWRAGPWPEDLTPSAPWSRRRAACLAHVTARSSSLPHSST